MLYPTEDALVDDTTVRMGSSSVQSAATLPSHSRSIQPGENRNYGKFCKDTMKSGHKDSKNKALTIPLLAAHTLRHANVNNRNAGDRTRHMGERAYTDSRHMRTPIDNYMGNLTPYDTPTDVFNTLDPSAPYNGVEISDFQHGGTRSDAVRGTMIGAGVSVPVNNLDGTNLNNSYGLHYAIDIGPGGKIGQMQQKELMRSTAQ
jgi:hypothetical protein